MEESSVTWNSVRSTLRAPSKRREAVIDETTYSFQDFNNVLRVKDHKVAVKFVIYYFNLSVHISNKILQYQRPYCWQHKCE